MTEPKDKPLEDDEQDHQEPDERAANRLAAASEPGQTPRAEKAGVAVREKPQLNEDGADGLQANLNELQANLNESLAQNLNRLGVKVTSRTLEGARAELENGFPGPYAREFFSKALKSGNASEALKEFIKTANQNPQTQIEDLTASTGKDLLQIRLHMPGNLARTVDIRLGSDGKGEFDQRAVIDSLDGDSLTSRAKPFDARSAAKRAEDAGILLPKHLSSETLGEARIPLPKEMGALKHFGRQLTVGEYARAAGLQGHEMNDYLQKVFYSSNDALIRKQAIQALRDEVTSNKNPSALAILQNLTVTKAAIELKEAEKSGDKEAQLRALTQIASLEGVSSLASDILNGQKPKLGEERKPHPLAEEARKSLKELAASTFVAADTAFGAFLSRELDNLPAWQRHEKRQEIIKNLGQASEQRLNLMARSDFEHVSRNFQAADAVLTIKETDDPRLASAQIKNLQELVRVKYDSTSNSYLNSLERKLAEAKAPTLDSLKIELEAGGMRSQKALKILQDACPDLKDDMNIYRIDHILGKINADSNSSDLTKASASLSDELKHGNARAAEHLLWTQASTAGLKIQEAVKARDIDNPESVKETAAVISAQLEQLSKYANAGNLAARTTLIGLVGNGISKEERENWKFFQNRPPVTPDLSGLSPQEVSLVKETSAKLLGDSLKKNPDGKPLSKEDGNMLAVAFSEANMQGDLKTQDAISRLYDIALAGKSRNSTIDGIIYTMDGDLKGSGKLSDVLVKAAANGGLSDAQFRNLTILAQYGTEGAVRTLGSFASGSVNEAYALSAASSLKHAGSAADSRERILDLLMDQYKKTGDTGTLLGTIGEIAAKDKLPNFSAQEIVRNGFAKFAGERSKDTLESANYKATRDGFLALAKSWTDKDIETFSANLRTDTLKALPAVLEKLPQDKTKQLFELEHSALLKGSASERIAAVQALAALSANVNEGAARDIAYFATKRGQEELKKSGLQPDEIKQMVELTGKALLVLMSSQNASVQDVAYDSLKKKEDWPGMLGNLELRDKVLDYVRGRPMDLELNSEAMKFIYDAGLSRPLAGILKDVGVRGSTEEIYKIADQIRANYSIEGANGSEVAKKVLANAVAINALPEDLREKLTGSASALDLSLVVGQLAKRSIDAGTPPNNPLFKDVKQWLKDEQEAKANDVVRLEKEIKSKEEFRGKCLKWMSEHTTEQNVGLFGRFTDVCGITDKENDFIRNQGMNVRRVERVNKEVGEKYTELSKTKTDAAFLNLAEQAQKHFELSAINVKQADQLLMTMVEKQGAQVLAKYTPTNFAQIDTAMYRLKLNELGVREKLPFYDGKDGFSQALNDLKKLQWRANDKNYAYDYGALKTTALQAIDSRTSFSKIQGAAAEISARLPVLQEMFTSGMQGGRYHEFVFTAKKHASMIQNALRDVSDKDLDDARAAIKEMKEAVKDASNPDSKKLLEDRIKAYEGALDLFRGGKQGGQIAYILDSILKKDSFDETTFENWALKEGPIVLASLVAAAAVIALTAGAATPVVVAGLIIAPAASLAAGELTKEGLKWAGARQEGSLLGEYLRGSEKFDKETGQMRALSLGDVGAEYGKQYAVDLAISLGTLGAGTLLAKGISKIGQATFGKLLVERGAEIANLSRGLSRAEIAAAQAGNKSFVKEFFHQLAMQSSFATKQAIGEDFLHPYMKGEYDKYVPLLVSMALITAHGVSFRPQGKFIEFDLKTNELSKAPDLLQKQMIQFHNDGLTVRPLKGGSFEVVNPKGEVTEFRPSQKVAEQLKDFKAPDWVTNAKPVIADARLGALGKMPGIEASGKPADVQAQASDRLAAKIPEQNDGKKPGRERDIYRPVIESPSEEVLHTVRQNFPEMTGKPVAEFDRRVRAVEERWTEDHTQKQARLNNVEAELRDAEMKLKSEKDACTDQLIETAQSELSVGGRSWYRRPVEERQALIQERVQEKITALEQNPTHPLGSARAAVERLRVEKDSLSKDLSGVLDARRADLQKELDFMHEKHGWPKVTLRVGESMVGSAGGYKFGTGEFFLPKATFLSANGKGNVHGTSFHEMVHAVQDHFIAEHSLKQAGGDIGKAKQIYDGLTNRTATPEFLEGVSKNPRVKEWNEQLDTRAKLLASKVNEGLDVGEDSVRLGKQAQFIEGRLHSLRRDKNGSSIENLFEHFASSEHGKQFQNGLFKNGVPEEVQKAYAEWKSFKENGTEFDRAAAKTVVERALETELAKTNKEHKDVVDRYAKNILEVEAYAADSELHYGKYAQEQAQGKELAPPPDTAQQVKDLMAEKAAKPKDSLHPQTRGFEKVKSMYEQKLADGSVTPSELRKILELPSEDRDVVERMLIKNAPSIELVKTLLRLENDQINKVLGLPGTICEKTILPALNRNLLEPAALNKLLSLVDSDRAVGLSFLEKIASDNSSKISKEAISRFMDLESGDKKVISNALAERAKNSPGALSDEHINAALMSPQRTSKGGRVISDAASIIGAMKSGVVKLENLSEFYKMDAAARPAFFALAKDILTPESAVKLLDDLKAGRISPEGLDDINTAFRKTMFTEKGFQNLMAQEPAVREVVYKSIAEESRKNWNDMAKLDVFLDRAISNNELVNAGVIKAETLSLIQSASAADLVLGPLLAAQRKLPSGDRVAPETLHKLVDMSQKGEISLAYLDLYREALAKGVLDAKSLDAVLKQSAENRRAAEMFMSIAPEKFAGLIKEQRFAEMASRVPELELPARKFFPDMFPESGNFERNPQNVVKGNGLAQPDVNHFMELMNQGKYNEALAFIETKTSVPEQRTDAEIRPEILWREKHIKLSDLNNPGELNEMYRFMMAQGNAHSSEKSGFSVKSINVADPVIDLPGGRSFCLRDAGRIYDNGNWRRSTPQERRFLESIQDSPSGKALIGKTGMIVLEEYAHTTQGPNGGISKLTSDFQMSPEYAQLKANYEAQGLKGEALSAVVNKTMREIDFAASLKDAGLSLSGLKKLLGEQHLKGEREFFYRYLDRLESAKKPSEGKGTSVDRVSDTGVESASQQKPPTQAASKTDSANSGKGFTVAETPSTGDSVGASKGFRPALETVQRKPVPEKSVPLTLTERSAKTTQDSGKTSGLKQFLEQGGKLESPEGQAKLQLAELFTKIEKLPDSFGKELHAFLEMSGTNPRGGRPQLAEHLLRIADEAGIDAARKTLEGMKKVCELEEGRSKAPAIPKLEEIFKPEELAKIKQIDAAQKTLKPLQPLTPEAQAAKVAEFYKLFADETPGGKPAQEKVMHLVVGPPGSGKTSTLVKPLVEEYQALVIDSDRIKPSLPGYNAEFQGKVEPGLGTNAVHHTSSMIANDVLKQAMERGDNIVYPILGRVPESILDIALRAKAMGYKVGIHLADVPPEVAARRVFNRALEPADESGVRQMVPPSYATGVAKYDPQIVFENLKTHMPDFFDAWRYANNNVPKGQAPVIERSPLQIKRPGDKK